MRALLRRKKNGDQRNTLVAILKNIGFKNKGNIA